MKSLDMSILISAVDKFTAPVKKIVGMSDKMTSAMLKGQKSINALAHQQRTIAQFRALGGRLRETAASMRAAQAKVAALGKAIAATDKPTKQMASEFERAKRISARLKDQYKRQLEELRPLRNELQGAGVDVRHLASAEDDLNAKMDVATRKMEQMAQAQGRLQHAQQKYDQAIQKAANISLVAGGVENVGRKLTGALTRPVEAAVSFESTMADVRKVVNFDTPQQFRQMRKDILNLSTVIPLSAKGIGDIIAAAGQANIPRQQLLAFADSAAKMGVAFDLTGEQAGKIMANWRQGLGLTQQQANSLADAVNHLSNNMNANAADLSLVIERQGAVAMSAGLTSTEVASLGAALLSSGAAPEIAATGMKNLTLSLAAGTAATKMQKDALASLGLDASAMAERMQTDAKGAIMDVFAAMSKLDKAKQPAILKQLFGLETVGAIAPLLKNLDNVRHAFDLTREKAAFAGSAQREFDVRSKTTENAITLFNNRLEKLAISFGNRLTPALNKVLDAVSPVVDWVSALADRFPKVTAVVLALVGGLGALALVAAPLITAYAALNIVMAKGALLARKRALAESLEQSGGGFFGGKGLKNKLKGAGRFLKGKGGLIGAGIAGISIASTLLGDSKNKGAEITQDVGGIGGALAGGAAGAAIGSVVPVIGTAVGGLIGSILGGIGGDALGGKLASLFSSDNKPAIAKAAPAALAATMVATAPAMAQPKPLIQPVAIASLPDLSAVRPAGAVSSPSPAVVHQDNRASYTLHMTVQGGDPEQTKQAVAEALAEKEREHAARTRGALFDYQGG